MNRHFITIFSLLAIAFLAVTVVKYMPDKQLKTSESSSIEKGQTKRNSDVVLFWQHYDKATELRIQGQHAEALKFYLKALDIDSTHQNSLYYTGNMQLAERNFTAAENTWKRLINIHNRSARGHLQLGNLYSCKTEDNPLYDLTAAMNHFEIAAGLNAEETGPRLQLAKIHLIDRNYNQAGQMLNNVISSNFRSIEAFFLNGYLKWRSGDTAEAEQQFKKATTIQLQSSEETSNVGEGETKAGNSPMLANAFRCSLFSEYIQQQLQGEEEITLNADTVYKNFDDTLSDY